MAALSVECAREGCGVEGQKLRCYVIIQPARGAMVGKYECVYMCV